MAPDQAAAEAAQAELETAQAQARESAARHLMVFWPRAELPRRGPDGVLRLGWGRPIERRPQPEDVSRMALQRDIEQVCKALERRVFVLLVAQPACQAKVGYLYAVADIIGVERIRDWDDLWLAACGGDWHTVSLQLIALQWDAVERDQVDRRMAAGNLILGMLHA